MASKNQVNQSLEAPPEIIVKDLTMGYGSFVLVHYLNFTLRRGNIFNMMGGSGCGENSGLRRLVGLKDSAKGEIIYGEPNFTTTDPATSGSRLRRLGILDQDGALRSSKIPAQNGGLPLGEFTDLAPRQTRKVAALESSRVGLKRFEDFGPDEVSGGMQKRADPTRAKALDPDILFFDEPCTGLDPLSSRLLDDLILVDSVSTREPRSSWSRRRWHALSQSPTTPSFSALNLELRSPPAILTNSSQIRKTPRLGLFSSRGEQGGNRHG